MSTEINKEATAEECCPDSTCAASGRKCCKHGFNTSSADELVQVGTNKWRRETATKPGRKKKRSDGDEASAGKNALCTILDTGSLTCSPSCMGYLDMWDKLDHNGDGVWSQTEALEDAENLGCQLHVSQEDMFHAVCRTIIMDIEDGATYRGVQKVVPQHIKERRAVPRKYFEWFQGMAAFCSTTSPGHCTSLLQKGVFTAAMDPDNWLGLGLHNIDDSMEYCNRLLSPGGLCGKMMPSSYSIYSSLVADKCGALKYIRGHMYRNPHDPYDGIRMLRPEFKKVLEFTQTTSIAFEFFLWLLLMTWFYHSMEEMHQICSVCDLLVTFPVIDVFPFMPPDKYHSLMNSISLGMFSWDVVPQRSLTIDPTAVKIDCISRPHQLTMGCMVIIRLSLLMYMLVVGTFFLLSNHKFLDLLLNAVALAFIFELDEFIFTFLVSDEVKKQLEQIKPIRFESSMPTNGFASLFFRRELWAYIIIPLCALSVVYWNQWHNLQPVLDALRCLCEKQGKNCEEADRFPSSWWDKYWKQRAMDI